MEGGKCGAERRSTLGKPTEKSRDWSRRLRNELVLYSTCQIRNFTANSTYQTNLKSLFSSLTSIVSFTGFLTQTAGEIPDEIYSLVLCRGDVDISDCVALLKNSTQYVVEHCPFSKGGTVWYEYCLFRYSDEPFILNSTDNSEQLFMWNTLNASNPVPFNKLVHELLNRTADWAVYNSTNKFATGKLINSTSQSPILYDLVQCTPDLSQSDCRSCLQELFNPLPELVQGKQGGRVIGLRCNIRYESYSFYNGTSMVKLTDSPAPQPPADHPENPVSQPEAGKGGNRKKNAGVLVAVPLVAAALLISVLIYICLRKRRRRSTTITELDDINCADQSLLLDLSVLQVATDNFSEENKLGEGGFGAVYKGSLSDGREIAVKRLATNSLQGLEELKNELISVAKLQHRNLVRLLGVCLDQEKMIVYEYVPNGSLDRFLWDPIRPKKLPWETRFKIISGISRGLLYLHDESRLKVIHRDLKASNILLDTDMNAKISDFGLARLFDGDQTQTHKSTNRIVGTFGYMAPEYVVHGQFSIKSDVFSFGVLVLEIVMGRKNSGFSPNEDAYDDLLSYTWKNWMSGRIMEVLDPTLGDQFPRSEVLRCIQIGLLCVQENPSDRPNMATVVLALNSSTVSIQAPSKPAFFSGTGSYSYPWNSQGGSHEWSSSKLMPVPISDEVTVSEFEPR
ncbi:cysteine-rich receptor-like protein kinase 10 [Canna indica]|uniref:Cysteine-rich receptor-like protein kinase 10 n=1 Tax=Canna indica TaxID=4628 RepID=A0AAQ3JP82_9LILI|nr:cysteine-rich receptor-like protein kinase 10 [Canna indica]